jgi:hypothetical protein
MRPAGPRSTLRKRRRLINQFRIAGGSVVSPEKIELSML